MCDMFETESWWKLTIQCVCTNTHVQHVHVHVQANILFMCCALFMNHSSNTCCRLHMLQEVDEVVTKFVFGPQNQSERAVRDVLNCWSDRLRLTQVKYYDEDMRFSAIFCLFLL